MQDIDFISLDDLALTLVNGGAEDLKKAAAALLKKDSGENGLTCEQAMAAHCSGMCTGEASRILKSLAGGTK